MLKTLDALQKWKIDEETKTLIFKLDNGYEVCLEPLIFDGQWYLAIYKDKDLLTDKICFKIGYE